MSCTRQKIHWPQFVTVYTAKTYQPCSFDSLQCYRKNVYISLCKFICTSKKRKKDPSGTQTYLMELNSAVVNAD